MRVSQGRRLFGGCVRCWGDRKERVCRCQGVMEDALGTKEVMVLVDSRLDRTACASTGNHKRQTRKRQASIFRKERIGVDLVVASHDDDDDDDLLEHVIDHVQE